MVSACAKWVREISLNLVWSVAVLVGGIGSFTAAMPSLAADGKGERAFVGLVTDAQGVETEIKNLVFYWEEKLSETSFVPHELKHVPAKRGTTTVNIKFETIKQIEIKSSADNTSPALTVTLSNGKTGEFVAAVSGSFKGESDFGPVEVPVSSASKVVLK